MSSKSVYLAGPIQGLTFDECVEWRRKAVVQFATINGPVEIIGMSPLRFKDFLKDEGELDGADGYPHVLCSPRGITARDFYDVRSCDSLLVNLLGSTTISIGTVMEITMAHQLQKPVVVAMSESGCLHDHPMLNTCIDFRVDTLDEAIRTTVMILAPGYHHDHYSPGHITWDHI